MANPQAQELQTLPVTEVEEHSPPAKHLSGWQKVINWHKNVWPGIDIPMFLLMIIIGLALWWAVPSGLTTQTWRIFVVFLVTIVGCVFEPLPISGVCIIAMGVLTVTNLISTAEILSGFANDTVWLIVFAFFISNGFVKTGLGKRICFYILKYIGSTTLGLGYSLCVCEFVLAIAIPSSTARAAGIMLPIILPLLKEGFQSDPEFKTEGRIGTYLVLVEIIANTTASVCWLTGGAWNAMMAGFMADVGVHVSWVEWAYSMAPVGILPLITAPLIIYVLYPPEIKRTPEAPQLAQKKLREMGPMSNAESTMLGVFLGVVFLWVLSSQVEAIPYGTAGVACIGVSVMLIAGIINVKQDIITDSAAFDLFIWFGVLLMLATQLKEKGFFEWFATLVNLNGVSPYPCLIILCSLFYVTQYAFASITAHVSAMFPVFLEIMKQSGVPMELGCRALAWTTLSGHLTHYTSSSNPPYYGLKYVSPSKWWLQGVIMMMCNLVMLFTLCWGYWYLLGFW